MTQEESVLTIEHLTAALRHAEGYLRAVRAALNTLEAQGPIPFPPSDAAEALTDRQSLGMTTSGACQIWRVPYCPPPDPSV